MKKAVRALAVAAAVTIVLAVAAAVFLRQRGIEVAVTEQQVQAWLETRFPQEETFGRPLTMRLKLEPPRVDLSPGSDRVSFSLDAMVSPKGLGGVRARGSATVSGVIHYEPDTAEFFVRDLRADRVEIKNLPGLLSLGEIQRAVGNLVISSLEDKPLYRLRDDRPGEGRLRAYLDDLRVEDGKIVARLRWR